VADWQVPTSHENVAETTEVGDVMGVEKGVEWPLAVPRGEASVESV